MKIALFSGTTEGRKLSEMLSKAGTEHFVFVATGYGSDVMEESPFAKVLVGRMDREEMIDLLEKNGFGKEDIIVDATHPYASEVSGNIKTAADELGCDLIRVRRASGTAEIGDIKYSYVNHYESFEKFAKTADSLEGNIFLTTGSRELETYCKNVSSQTLEKTYVRVIPATESLAICENLGIEKSHVIAMQGPFSYEMNKALIGQYDIRHLVTKESGKTGGFSEKVRAAADLGIYIHIIDRPDESDAAQKLTTEEAFERLTGRKYRRKRKITLCGIGMGSLSSMTMETTDAVRNADAVFGAKRMLEACDRAHLIKTAEKHEMYLAKDIIRVLDEEVDIKSAVILFSGDTGFCSGAKEAYRELAAWDETAEITILPGVSSVSYLAAKCHESYDDAAIVSIHGKNSLHNIEELVNTVAVRRKTFALMSGDEDVRSVGALLTERNILAKLIIGRDMSAGDVSVDGDGRAEETVMIDARDAINYTGAGLITVLFINDSPDI